MNNARASDKNEKEKAEAEAASREERRSKAIKSQSNVNNIKETLLPLTVLGCHALPCSDPKREREMGDGRWEMEEEGSS